MRRRVNADRLRAAARLHLRIDDARRVLRDDAEKVAALAAATACSTENVPRKIEPQRIRGNLHGRSDADHAQAAAGDDEDLLGGTAVAVEIERVQSAEIDRQRRYPLRRGDAC